MVKSFKELIVWQKAMDLAEEVYLLSKKFPKEEMYSLTNQIRRAVVSVASNIAEGQSRKSTLEFSQFLSIAQGSNAEVETQILISIRLKYQTEAQSLKALQLSEEISKMLGSLQRKLLASS